MIKLRKSLLQLKISTAKTACVVTVECFQGKSNQVRESKISFDEGVGCEAMDDFDVDGTGSKASKQTAPPLLSTTKLGRIDGPKIVAS